MIISALEQNVKSQLAVMGITEDMPNYDTILQGFLAAKQREIELAEENERLKASSNRKVAKVVLPPAKQLFLNLLEDMPTAEDKHEENFQDIAALVLVAAQKLAAGAGVYDEDDRVLDFAKDLLHFSDARDSLIYLLQDAFATAKTQGKVSYGRKRQINSVAKATPQSTAVEGDEPVF